MGLLLRLWRARRPPPAPIPDIWVDDVDAVYCNGQRLREGEDYVRVDGEIWTGKVTFG